MSSEVQRRYTVAEFFCGCGGLSHGFQRSGRFDVVFGNDVKPEALRTFAANHSFQGQPSSILSDDIRVLTIERVRATLERHGMDSGELDCLIGGPPCQGFSQMRRSEERKRGEIVRFKGYDRLAHDPRNDLVLRFLEIAVSLSPKVILIENVPQMLRHGHKGKAGTLAESVRLLLREMGYSTAVDVVNAADYGVPQLRERAIFLASRIGPIDFPTITHVDPDSEELLSKNLPRWRTVEDAISDLPMDPPLGHDELGGGPLSHYCSAGTSQYVRLMRTSDRFPFNHITRKYNDRVLSLVKCIRPGETWDDASERLQTKYDHLVEKHRRSGESKAATLRRLEKERLVNTTFYKRYYWSAYTRLNWDRPALTITANANFLGSGRFTHPERDRGITMREAARLQSFDDAFTFITDERKESHTTNIGVGLDMIGEAVPPLLGESFAYQIARALDFNASKNAAVQMAQVGRGNDNLAKGLSGNATNG